MVNAGKILNLAERIEANYIAKNLLKSNFKSRSPLSFGKKELRYCLPAITRRVNKLKKEYKKLTGVEYHRSGDLIHGIERLEKRYGD